MKLVKQIMAFWVFVTVMGVAFPLMAADAPKAVEVKKDLILKGDAKCTGCHDEADDPVPSMLDLHPSVLAIGKTKHGTKADGRTPTCTSCHGESLDHLNYAGKDKPPKPERWFSKKSNVSAAERNEACLSCHQGGNRIAWQSSTHATRDVACTSCHQIHAKHDKVRDKATQTETCFTCHKEQRAQMNRVSHHPVPEGKMSCSSCHNVHGDNPKQLVKASTNETCYTCHMEKRGPFVHAHEPVTEDCGICHNAHGTNIANLLKSRPPMLCVACHGPSSHPTQPPALPQGTATLTVNNTSRIMGTVGRGCLNCHTNIHGGNSTQTNVTVERFRR